MSVYTKEHVMINSILNRRSKHLAQLKLDSSSTSQVRVWEKFYSRLLSKYANSCEVKYYD